MSFNQPAPHLLDGDPSPERRLQAINGQGKFLLLDAGFPNNFSEIHLISHDGICELNFLYQINI